MYPSPTPEEERNTTHLTGCVFFTARRQELKWYHRVTATGTASHSSPLQLAQQQDHRNKPAGHYTPTHPHKKHTIKTTIVSTV